MSTRRLTAFTEEDDPHIRLTKPILHPNRHKSVIGHIGTDKGRGVDGVAVFPRTKREHWFRGENTSGLKGYGISEDVLDYLDETPTEISRIIIVVRDEATVVEYDRPTFSDGTLVAYSPEQNDSVIGESSRVDHEVYHDKQRVVPVEKARQTFDREAVTLTR